MLTYMLFLTMCLQSHHPPTQILCANYKKNVINLTILITILLCQIGQEKQMNKQDIK